MKIQRSLLSLAVVLAVLVGCETFPKSGPSALVGTWTNSMNTVWMIKADGTYDADLNGDGKRDAWGKWTVEGDTVTVWRTGGMRPKSCEGKGVYKFTRTEDGLQFTFVKDKCALRKKNILLPWKKK